MKEKLKKYIPSSIWSITRQIFFSIKKVLITLGPKNRVVKYCGFNLHYVNGSSIMNRVKTDVIFEEKLCQNLVNSIKDSNGVFMDIGSNIGLISLYVKSKLPNTKIYAFEPGNSQFDLFTKTISTNIISNIQLYNLALGDKDDKVNFYVHDNSESALDGLIDTKRRGKTKSIEVKMMKLDTWWNENNRERVSVMKIDTEGSELLVLRGAKEMIRECNPTIFLEIEESNLKVYPYNFDDINSYFREIGYTLTKLNDDTYVGRSN